MMELTPLIIEKLCSYVRLGVNVFVAARAEGIPPSVVSSWAQKAESSSNNIYRDFINKISQAEAQGEILHVQRIVASGKAKESQWLLERMYPEKWGLKKQSQKQIEELDAIIEGIYLEKPKQITHKKK